MIDYGSFPPEVNSARIYSGPGSGPMLAAAAAWRQLAAEFRSAAVSFDWLVSNLASRGWWGPSASAMMRAAAPYQTWMNATAEQAEHAAAQAYAAADAYSSAYAMTVPPQAIATNRMLLASLVKTNALGQNTPAIAALEARYGQMWAQDAVAMYGYAAASATATRLIPFADAPETATPDGEARQAGTLAEAANAQSRLPTALQSMASPAEGTSPSSPDWDWTKFFDGLFGDIWGSDDGSGLNINAQLWNTIAATGIFDPGGNIEGFSGLATLGFLARGMDGGTAALSHSGIGAGPGMALASAAGGGLETASRAAGTGFQVSAGMGRATLVGSLSTPPGWAAATPSGAPATGGSGWTVTPESRSMTALPPPVPPGAGGRSGNSGLGMPRYGVKLTVMPRPVGVG